MRKVKAIWLGHRVLVASFLVAALCVLISASAFAAAGVLGEEQSTSTVSETSTTQVPDVTTPDETTTSTTLSDATTTTTSFPETTTTTTEVAYKLCVGVVKAYSSESITVLSKKGQEMVFAITSETVVHVAGGKQIQPGFKAEVLYIPGETNVAVRINAQKIVLSFTGIVKDFVAPTSGEQSALGSITVARGAKSLTFAVTSETKIYGLGKLRKQGQVGITPGLRVTVRYDLLKNALVIKVLPGMVKEKPSRFEGASSKSTDETRAGNADGNNGRGKARGLQK